MERRRIILPILVLTLAACGPKGFHTPVASTTTAPVTTYTPPNVVETKVHFESLENGKSVKRTASIVDGATAMKDWLVTTDGDKNTVLLKGSLSLRPREGSAPVQIPVHLGGVFKVSESTGFHVANLSPVNHMVLRELRVEVSAKLMCLAEDCSEYFINIYVRHNNQKDLFYRHQVHRVIEPFTPPKTDQSDDEAAEENAGSTMDGEYYENDAAESEPTYYVGETSTDLGEFESVSKAKPAAEVTGVKKTGTAGSPNSAPVKEPKAADLVKAPIVEARPKGSSKTKQPKAVAPPTVPSQTAPPARPNTTAVPPRTEGTATPPASQPAAPAAPAPAQPAPAQPAQTEPPRTEAVPKLDLSKVLNQAIGFAYKGKLQRANSFLELPNEPEKLGFRIMHPHKQSHFATKDMMSIMLHTGLYSLRHANNYILNVGDVSYKGGGQIGRHDSHQNGLDADVSYFLNIPNLATNKFQDALESKAVLSSWMVDAQWALFKELTETDNVDRVFIHPYMKHLLCERAKAKNEINGDAGSTLAHETLRRLRPEPSHGNHFHLRLQCSSVQKLCRMMAAPATGAGCDTCEARVKVVVGKDRKGKNKYKTVTKKCSELGPEA